MPSVRPSNLDSWEKHLGLRNLRVLPTIRVHPELDGRTLDIVHSLNKAFSCILSRCYNTHQE